MSEQLYVELKASFCDAPDGSGNENWRDAIKTYETEKFRLGVSDMTGKLCYGGGKEVDVWERNYFRQAVETSLLLS